MKELKVQRYLQNLKKIKCGGIIENLGKRSADPNKLLLNNAMSFMPLCTISVFQSLAQRSSVTCDWRAQRQGLYIEKSTLWC